MTWNWKYLVQGLLFLAIGVFLLWNWKKLLADAIASGEVFWGTFGIRQRFIGFQKIVGAILSIILGCALTAAGLLMLYAFLSGRTVPLQLRDLQPF